MEIPPPAPARYKYLWYRIVYRIPYKNRGKRRTSAVCREENILIVDVAQLAVKSFLAHLKFESSMYMEIFRGCYNCLRHLVTLIFGWLLQDEMSRPLSETAAGARSASELVSTATRYN